MKRLTEQLKHALSALAHADAGEMQPRRDKARYITESGTAGTPAPKEIRREVALGLGDLLSPRAMRYALGACQRLDAGLCVLSANVDAAWRMLDPYREEWQAAGVRCRIEPIGGRHDVLAFFDSRPHILFAVAGGYGDPLSSFVGNRRRLARRKPPVPIVLVDSGNIDPAPLPAIPELGFAAAG